jgi:PKD repeat protein
MRTFCRFIDRKIILISLIFLASPSTLLAQLPGSPASGQDAIKICVPAEYKIDYSYTLLIGVEPTGSFRVLMRFLDSEGNAIPGYSVNKTGTGLNKYQLPSGRWIIETEHIFTLPIRSDCEYSIEIYLFNDPDGGTNWTVVSGAGQIQRITNWHRDDYPGAGEIIIDPEEELVCEGYPLENFTFRDVSLFACTDSDLNSPNIQERYVQFVYGTNPGIDKSIPNLSINVHGTIVYLTDGNGIPHTGPWTVDPQTGLSVAPYNTVSGFFEGPVISTGLYPLSGSQESFPISFPGVDVDGNPETKADDYFEVTIRNWNWCNQWNNSQTSPNANIAAISTARITIVDTPKAPKVPSKLICFDDPDKTLTLTSTPYGAADNIHWYNESFQLVATGLSYTPPVSAADIYTFYVTDRAVDAITCISPETEVTLTILPLITNNIIEGDEEICYNTTAALITGSEPSGGDEAADVPYVYEWERRTTGAWTIIDEATGKDYEPGVLTQTTEFRRIVKSGEKTILVEGEPEIIYVCEDVSLPITITVIPNNTISLSSAAWTNNQTVCIHTPITNITYSTTGAIGALFKDLPNGVTGNWNGDVVTISGTPSESGTFNYEIELTGGCGIIIENGTITVNPDNTIVLSSAAWTDDQTVCINTEIIDIRYTTTGATGATFSNLPAGVSGVWAGNVVTISGTPTVSGPFDYTVTLTGGCAIVIATGTITVSPDNTIVLSSDPETVNQAVCLNTPITSITYNTTGATGADFAELPDGVSGTWAADVVTINGAPSVSGTFNYTVTLTGGCAIVTAAGSITVDPLPTVNAGPVMTAICQGGMSAVLGGSVGGSATGGIWSTTAGGTFAPADNDLNATWTPPAIFSGTATLILTTIGGACDAATDSKTIVVSPLPTPVISGDYSVCASIGGYIYSTPATGNSFFWEISGGLITGGQGTQEITVEWGAAGPGWVRVTETQGGCPLTTGNYHVTINPGAPGAANNITDVNQICYNGSVTLTTTPVDNSDFYIWTTPTGDINGGLSIDYDFTLLGAGTYNFSVRASNGCGDGPPSDIVTITVRPTPSATIAGNTTVCQDGAEPMVTFTNPMALPVTVTYNINGGSDLTVNVAANSMTDVPAPTIAGGVFAYNLVSVAYQDVPSCPADISGSATVTVRPTPSATIAGNTTVCQGGAEPMVTFTNPMALPVTVTYNINGGSDLTINIGASTNSNVPAPTGAAGVFAYNLVSVAYQDGPSCPADVSGSATVTVRPTPSATVAGNTTVCQGGAEPMVTLTNPMALPVTVTYNINGGSDLTINIGASTNSNVPAPTGAAGVFAYNLVSVAYQDGPSCPADVSGSATVTVRPTPSATVAGNTTVCQGGAEPMVTFTNPMALPVTVTYNINGGSDLTINIGASTNSNVPAPTGAAGVFAYNLVSVAYQDGPSCPADVSGSATVTVRPTPSATVAGNTTVCQGGAEPMVTFTNPMALPVTVTYNINGGSDLTINIGASTNSNVPAPTGAAGVFAYNLVSVAYQDGPSCPADVSGSATVTVRPTPSATVAGNTTVCQGGAEPMVTFTNPMALPVTVTYNINGGSDLTINIGASTNSNVPAPTGAAGVFAYNLVSVAYQDGPSCPADVSGSATVTVRPTPSATVAGNTTVCQGGAEPMVTFTNPMALPVTVTYNINGGSDLTINIGASTNSNVPAPTGAAGVFAYNLVSVAYQDGPSCPADVSGSATVTVRPTPSATVAGNTTVCQGGAEPMVTFTNPMALPVTVTYNINGGSDLTINIGASTNSNVPAPTGAAGVFAYNLVSVAYQDGPSCPADVSGSATVTVRPTPSATVAGNTTVCQGGAEPMVTFTNPMALPVTVTYNINGGSDLTINIGASTNSNVPAPTGAAGVFAYNLVSVAYQDGPSCPADVSGSATVTVRPTPSATVAGNTTVCQGGAEPMVTFTNPMALPVTVTYNINGGSDLTINIGASTNSNVPAPTGAAGVFAYNLVSVAYQDGPSCPADVSGSATVTVRPTPSATVAGNTTVCQGGAEPMVTFTNPMALPVTVTYNINGGSDLTINIGASTNSNVPAPTGAAGVFAYNLVSVAYQDGPSCPADVSGSATVTVRPTPSATVAGNTTVCQGGAEPMVTFTNPMALPVTVTYNINGGSDLTINIGASTNSNVPAPTGAAGVFAYNLVSVAYQDGPSCPADVSGSATVTVRPTPSATVAGNTTVCQGGAEPMVTFTNPMALPVTVTYNINGGSDLTINIGASTNSNVPAPTGAAGVFAYNLVSVAYQDGPSCPADVSGSATVTVRPTPSATVAGNTTVCQGGAEPMVTFTNPMALPVTVTYNINGGSDLTINIGASTNSNVPAPTGAAGVFAYNLVSVAYQDGPSCPADVSGSATVTVRPTPSATVAGNTTVCQGGAEPMVTFTNPMALPVTVTYNINGGSDLTINIGASTNSNVPAPTGAAGVFAYNLVSVAYQDGPSCPADVSGSATVTVRPTPSATVAGNTTVCQGGAEPMVTFTNPMALPVTVTYNINGGSDLTINIGASTNSNVPAPTGAAGVFAYNLVSVAYQDGPSCPADVSGSATVTVRPTPSATVAGNTTVCQGGAEPMVTFTNPMALPVTVTYNINGGSDLTINIGASTNSNVPAPTGAAGVFAYNLVSVAYQDGPSCPADVSGSATVTVRPTPSATVAGNTTVCQGGAEPMVTFTNPMALPVTVTYNINGGSDLTINIGASTNSNVPAPTGAAGVFAYNLVSVAYQDGPSCPADVSGSATVTVRPTPSATVAGNTTVCQGGAEPMVTFTNPMALPVTVTYNINGGSDLTINIGASTNSNVPAPTGAAGVFAYNLVSVAYQDGPSCPADVSGSATVTVRPTPSATVAGNTTVCQGGAEPMVTFTNPMALPVTVTYNINGGSDLTINIGASTNSNVPAPTGAAGVFAYNLVSVAYQDGPSCPADVSGSATVTVRPTPSVTITGPVAVCQDGAYPDITITNPMELPVTVTYAINGETPILIDIAGASSVNIERPTEVPGTYVYVLHSVQYQDGPVCPSPLAETHTITVNPTPVTSIIFGNAELCENTEDRIFQVTPTTGSTYTWSVPEDLVDKKFDINTYFIIVDGLPGASGTGEITVFETALGCPGLPQTKVITVTALPEPVMVFGSTEICVGGTETYTVPFNEGSTYAWSVPAGASIISADPTLHTVDITFNMVVENQQIGVIEYNGACMMAHDPLLVTVYALPVKYTVTAPAYYCFEANGVTVTLSNSQTGMDYQLFKGVDPVGTSQPGLNNSALTWEEMTAGVYTVKATRSTGPGCTVEMNGSPLVEWNPEIVISSINVVPPLCNGAANGTIQINASGGYPPLSYSINGGSSYQSSNLFTNVAAGTYDIIVRDARNCMVAETEEVSEPDVLVINSLVVSGEISCFGESDGSLKVEASGGTPVAGSYIFEWFYDSGMTSPVPGQVTDEATGLAAGTYWVKVTDLNGCQVSASISITQPTAITATIAVTSDYNGSDISCFGEADGEITVTASGGTGNLGYAIVDFPGNTTGATSGQFTGLPAGIYRVIVTDEKGCPFTTGEVTVSNPEILTATAEVTSDFNGYHISCIDASDGVITVSAAGGTGALTYAIDELPLNTTGVDTGVFTGIPAGIYNITVTDLNGCFDQYEVTVTAPEVLLPGSIGGVDPICHGDTPQLLSQTEAPAGGIGNYTFQWQSSSDIAGPYADISGAVSASYQTPAGDPGTTYYRRKVTSGTCEPLFTVPVEVIINAIPVMTATLAETEICNGGNVVIALDTDLPLTTTYTWTVSAAGMGATPNATGAAHPYTIVQALTNGTSTNQTVTYTITPWSNDCPGTERVVTVTVRPDAVINVDPANAVICEDGDTGFTVTASGVDVYQWQYDNGGGWTNAGEGMDIEGSVFTGTQTASLTITGVHSSLDGYRFRVRFDGCGGEDWSEPATLTVLLKPRITDLLSEDSYCVNTAASFGVEASGSGDLSYQWQMSINGGASWSSLVDGIEFSGSASEMLTINPVSSFMNGYLLRVRVSGDCTPVAISDEITINTIPAPLITVQPMSALVCEGTDALFEIKADGSDLSFEWQMLDGGDWVTVEADADHDIISQPNESSLTVKEVDYILMHGNRYRAVVSNDCGTMTSVEVILNIRTAPEIFARPSDIVACEGADVIFTVTEASYEDPSYMWQVKESGMPDFIDIAAADPGYTGHDTRALTVVNVSAGMAGNLYRVIVTNGCGPTISHEALLTVDRQVEITDQPGDAAICEKGDATFSAEAEGEPAPGMTGLAYQWEVFIAGNWHNVIGGSYYSGTNTPVLTVNNAALSLNGSLYRLRVTGKCATTWSNEVTLTVYENPQPSILPVPAGVKVGAVLMLDGNPLGGTEPYQVHEWDGAVFHLSGALDGQMLEFSSSAVGDFFLTYTVTDANGCVGTDNVTVNVTQDISVIIDVEGSNIEVCADTGRQLSPSVSGGSIIVGHEWTGLGDIYDYLSATEIANPVFSSSVPGVYPLTYTVTDIYGTQASAEIIVTVLERPVAAISGDGLFPLVCGGTPLQLNGNPSGGSGSYHPHRWTGQTMALNETDIVNPVFNTVVAGTYTLEYQVTDSKGCISDVVSVEVVNQIPSANFSSDAVPGCTPMIVKFTNNSNGAVAYEWDFGDGSDIVTQDSPSHEFENLSSTIQYYEVTLTAISESGCENKVSRVVTVYPGIDSHFTATPESVCSPDIITFTTTPGAREYYWDFGDGTQEIAGATVVHLFTNSGDTDRVYNVRLRTTSYYGCTDEAEMEVTIHATPRAGFVANPMVQMYPSTTVSFTNTGSSGSGYSYSWDLGDGNVSSAENPVHSYATHGDYNVILEVSNDHCSKSIAHVVKIQPTTPIAAFDDVMPDCSPMTVSFINNTLYADTYLWDFGNGATSIERNPTYTYHNPGIYRVRLIATGDGGQDEYSSFVTVLVSPVAYMNVAPNYVYVNDQHVVTFNLSHNGDTYLWDFGDGDFSNDLEPIHVYREAGIYDVALEVWTDEGCYDKYTKTQAVLVDQAGGIQFPTGFRPGNEPTGGHVDPSADEYERNRVFAPGMSEKVSEYRLTIHNRWGEILFESFDINIGWDGFVNGVKVKQDVYIWKVTGKYSDGEPFVMAGDITLLR